MAKTDPVIPAAEAAPVTDDWKIMKSVHLPRAAQGEDKFLFVGVNGRNMQVPKGKMVEVPLPIYERIQIMLDMQDEDAEYRESIPNDYAKQSMAQFV